MSVATLKLSSYTFSSSDLNKFQKSEAYIILGIKFLISFAFLMMLFPVVKNVQYAFIQSHTSNNEYNRNTAVLYPMYVGDQIINLINNNKQADKIDTHRIFKIVDKNDGQTFSVNSQFDGTELITTNFNYIKEHPIRNIKNEVIKLPSRDKFLFLIPKSLNSSTLDIKKFIPISNFSSVKLEVINDIQIFKIHNKNTKFVNTPVFVASSYNKTNNSFINGINVPDGGGVNDPVQFPLKGNNTKFVYTKMLKDLKKGNYQYTYPSLLRLSEVDHVKREQVMGNVLFYSTELISSLIFIFLSSIISYSLLITSNKKRYVLKEIFGYTRLKSYSNIIIIPLIECLILITLSIKILDLSIYASIGFLTFINYLILFTLMKIMDKKNIKELFSEV
ncbi:hypothetical protein [Companilactobacillus hulinensis]|uniref:hypothetical protein n=1 Tax=Companilactobacillus hulinensis TaxID=2486007 RepID=UPI000F77C7E7|nr:hypothetical protein [Companilactobacillus hulinensis]